MPLYHRVYTPGQLQFITTCTYRRTRLFPSDRFRRCFVQRLREAGQPANQGLSKLEIGGSRLLGKRVFLSHGAPLRVAGKLRLDMAAAQGRGKVPVA